MAALRALGYCDTGNAKEKIVTDDTGPSDALHKSLKVDIAQSSPGNELGLANAGYWGMAVRPSTIYRGSFYAKAERVGSAHARLVSDETGVTLAETTVDVKDGDWQRYSYNLKTAADVKPRVKNHLEIPFAHPGSASFQLVSLFPPTFHDRPDGNRPDVMEMLAAMHPNFCDCLAAIIWRGTLLKSGLTGERLWGRWSIVRHTAVPGTINQPTVWVCLSFWNGAKT